MHLTNPSSDAAGSILAAGFVSRDTAEWVARLAHLWRARSENA